MAETVQRLDWFMPPEGILDGIDKDVALAYLDRALADHRHISENPLYGFYEHIPCPQQEMNLSEKFVEDLRHRILNGDRELTEAFAMQVHLEVLELEKGERGTVTGEAHLFFARRRAILDLSSAAICASDS